MPSVVCSSCSKGYRVPDEAAGKKFKCKNCGGVIAVPGNAAVAAVKPMVAVAKPRTIPTPPPLPVASAYAEPETGDAELDALASLETGGVVDNLVPFTATQPTSKNNRAGTTSNLRPPKSSTRFAFGFHPSRLPIILIVIGLGLAIWGGKEALLASGATDTPQNITCADLAANGPGTNAHVRVTNFKSMSNFVFRKSATGDWQTAWLPIIPPSAVKPPNGRRLRPGSKIIPKDFVDSSNIHVLIKTHTVRSQADVDGAMKRDEVEGLVINKIEKLTDNERELFQNAYPQMDSDNVYIVEDGRMPAGGTGMLGLIGGGVLLLCGLFILFRPVS
jgi:hypothetical protein